MINDMKEEAENENLYARTVEKLAQIMPINHITVNISTNLHSYDIKWNLISTK